MLNNENKRNPFKMIGKIYKYEAKNLSRMFIPLFSGIILLGIVVGFTLPKITFTNVDEVNKSIKLYEKGELDYNILMTTAVQTFQIEGSTDNSISDTREIAFLISTLIFYITCIASWVLLIVFMDKRLRKGFNDDEALLNFSLPVTMGEHIAGRFLCYISFFLFWVLAIIIATIFRVLKYITPQTLKLVSIAIRETATFSGQKTSIAPFVITVIISLLAINILWISFAFFEKAIGMIFPKKRTLMQTVIELPLIILWFYLMFKIGNNATTVFSLLGHISAIIMNLTLSVFFTGFTYFTFKKKLNIE